MATIESLPEYQQLTESSKKRLHAGLTEFKAGMFDLLAKRLYGDDAEAERAFLENADRG